ncbi:MAG UNVERIFIED_CONTAM: hypothetical protein LVT10_15410, partial [Anaerolineae bacterium]
CRCSFVRVAGRILVGMALALLAWWFLLQLDFPAVPHPTRPGVCGGDGGHGNLQQADLSGIAGN